MNLIVKYFKRRQFHKFGYRTVKEHMLGKIHPFIIQAAIDTHKNSRDRELRWFGEGMQEAFDKYRDEAWQDMPAV